MNGPRAFAGVVSCNKYLWVFGGYTSYIRDCIDKIERVSLDTGGIFE